LVLKPSSLERASPAAAAAPSASGVRAPRVPERFEVLRFLGQGGMGSVYEVFDRRRTRFTASSSPPIMRAFARRVGAAVHFRSGRLRAALREVQKSPRHCEAQPA
jgi:hypothetical protein